jgi:hypothetical protein
MSNSKIRASILWAAMVGSLILSSGVASANGIWGI